MCVCPHVPLPATAPSSGAVGGNKAIKVPTFMKYTVQMRFSKLFDHDL